jgi:hypothetical protein
MRPRGKAQLSRGLLIGALLQINPFLSGFLLASWKRAAAYEIC